MSADNIGSLLYIGVLLAVVGGALLLQNRHRLGVLAQQAAIWGLIFIGVIAAVGLWDDIRTTVPDTQASFSEAGDIVVPRGPGGHYYLTLHLNDVPVRFIVDTGASDMVLSLEDARRIGLDPDQMRFLNQARTANGTVQTEQVRIATVSLGPVSDQNISARVSQGEMPGSLLGMGYLSRFASVRIEDGTMTLTP
ncbi:TIGR02281 family clan AA aspartic protease [Pseudoruegeria sp. SK021]|uniref:retropepsin-like aspartic protease family protein n=1 Tax=Pseudoruegeria sp. SK021 TaxID=1933035 RepID=UPI000A262E4E|nr:TIGR02281 family clan AA aspartic protease [Pseudoruegeria sp. SK021]OSP55416.1 aspartyl protease [Pseudoruegeria sp. SK021]